MDDEKATAVERLVRYLLWNKGLGHLMHGKRQCENIRVWYIGIGMNVGTTC